MTEIPFLRPELVPLESYEGYIREAEACRIHSNFGPLVSKLERRIIAEIYGGAGAGTTVSNATIGLILSLRLLARPRGRYVVMPSFTFAATPQSAQWAGFEPYFLDVDPATWALRPDAVLETVERLGDDVAAVMPYATFGTCLDLAPYRRLEAMGIPVVVDAAASFGATRDNVAFGLDFPGAVVFSFHATKAFPIGEGGFVYSGDAAFIGRLRRASNFGFSDRRVAEEVGLNGKLPEVAGAIGLATLDVYAEKMSRRIALRQIYLDLMRERGMFDRGWRVQECVGRIPHQFMPVLCPEADTGDAHGKSAAEAGVMTRNYFNPPCHRHPIYTRAAAANLPVTDALARRSLSLPLWESMTDDTVSTVLDAIAAA